LKKFYLLNKFTTIFCMSITYVINLKNVMTNLEKFETKNRIFDKHNKKTNHYGKFLFILLFPRPGTQKGLHVPWDL